MQWSSESTQDARALRAPIVLPSPNAPASTVDALSLIHISEPTRPY